MTISHSFFNLAQHFQYTLKGTLTLVAAGINFLIGILILTREPHSKTNRSFFFLAYSTTMWLFFYALLQLASNEQDAYLYLGLAYLLGIPFISPAGYFFSQAWTKKKTSALAKWVIWGSAVTIAFSMFFFSRSLCEFRMHDWGRLNHFRPTLGSHLFLILMLTNFIVLPCIAFSNFYRAWKNASSPQEKNQYGYFLFAFVLGYTGSMDLLVAIGASEIHYGFISATLYNLVIAYAMIKYQFLNVNLFLKKAGLIILIYALLSIVALPVAIPLSMHAFSHGFHPSPFLFISLSLIAGLFFSMGPLIYAYLERHTIWLKSHITTGLTHELKSPISSIRGAVEFLQVQRNNPNRRDNDVDDYLAMIDQNSMRLESYVKDLLQIAKSQEGISTLERTNQDLVALLKSIEESHATQLQTKNLTLRVIAPTSFNTYIDKEKIHQTLSNLLSNAIKFSDNGKIEITVTTNPNECKISVRDQGRGIARPHLEKIFERFYQVDKNNKGSGIGLSIAKAWVEAHGGKIWAESDGEGKGTTVAFTLPLN
jgi:signal transduction histidine kinase